MVVDVPAERIVPDHEVIQVLAGARDGAEVFGVHEAEDVVDYFGRELRDQDHLAFP